MKTIRIFSFLVSLGILGAAARAHAQVGSGVRESFKLASVVFPLPEGDFLLASMATHNAYKGPGTFADVLVAQIDDRSLRVGVIASALIGSDAIYWLDEPCERSDALFKLDLSERNFNQDCLLVHALRPSRVSREAFGWAWLAKRNVEIPGDLLIVASITRFDRFKFARAEYFFSPALAGCAGRLREGAAGRDIEWTRFLDSVIEWGKFAQRWLKETVAEAPPPALQPVKIYQCKPKQPEDFRRGDRISLF